MTDDFEALIRAVRSCSPEQKQRIFDEIRDFIAVHRLEKIFNVRAEVILEAISRAPDLTQRGVRGVIAETIFELDVVPALQGWQEEPIEGNPPYDLYLSRGDCRVRIQVKMQRKKEGKAMVRDGLFVVEVQRTRAGEKDGISTRPYRFGEFDLLAVCMEPSTKVWTNFMYAPASKLDFDPADAQIIKTFQSVPAFSTGDQGIWTGDLPKVLRELCRSTT